MRAPSPLPFAGCGTVHVDCRYNVPLTFGYDAATSEGKRRPATGILRSEDAELPPLDRRKLVSQTRDVARNFVVAGWMLRQHLNYTTSFRLQVDTANEQFTAAIERLMAHWQRPEQCDVTSRMSLLTMLRIAEARATLDGDCGLHLIADGRLQAIEGDRIRTPLGGLPPEIDPASIVHGVQVDDVGRALAYCVTKRGRASDFAPNGQDFQFERMVPGSQFRLHGYFDRFDQVRGISPLAGALNTLVDVYEGFDLALAKMKLAQLFALAFFRGDPASITTEQRESGQDYTKLKLGKNPFVLDMDVGDQVQFLESKTPSSEFQAFTQLLIQVALKALDIPYSFFNESFTNYSGSRQALLQYDQSAQVRREATRGLLDFLTAWRLRLAMFAGELPFVPLETISCEWVPTGLPWIDPLKEVQGDLAAISGGLDCRTDVLKARGKDFEKVVRKLARENQLLAELGLPTTVQPNNALIQELVANG